MYNFQCTILNRATDNFADVLVTHAKDLGCQRCSYFCSQGRRIYRLPDRLLDYCCCTTYSESLKCRKCIIVFVTSTLDRWAIDGKVSKRVNKNINVEMGFSHKQMGKTILKLFVWHPFWKPCLLDIINDVLVTRRIGEHSHQCLMCLWPVHYDVVWVFSYRPHVAIKCLFQLHKSVGKPWGNPKEKHSVGNKNGYSRWSNVSGTTSQEQSR